MEYDPAVISYEKLLEVFWDSHTPDMPPWSRQYMSIIFYHNEEQKRLATVSKDLQAVRTKGRVYTEIVPIREFYLAEDYHQKYRLRSDRDLMKEFSTMYPAKEDFVNSTAAARINGYLDGYGGHGELLEGLSGLGLSQTAGEKLIRTVKKRKGKVACKL